MPETITCPRCNGGGSREVLVNAHDDETEIEVCSYCNGTGVIHQMTDEEERDYHENYW